MERLAISHINLNESSEYNKKTIKIASDWIIGYLNNLGGDFSTIELNGNQATISNKTSCPCFEVSSKFGDVSRCTTIEKIINRCICDDDSNLTASFICCSCNKDAVCTMVINLDRWQE